MLFRSSQLSSLKISASTPPLAKRGYPCRVSMSRMRNSFNSHRSDGFSFRATMKFSKKRKTPRPSRNRLEGQEARRGAIRSKLGNPCWSRSLGALKSFRGRAVHPDDQSDCSGGLWIEKRDGLGFRREPDVQGRPHRPRPPCAGGRFHAPGFGSFRFPFGEGPFAISFPP